MGDEAYKAWGLRATIVAMRPLTHPSPSLHRTHYGLLDDGRARATPWSSDLKLGSLNLTTLLQNRANAHPPSSQNAVAGIVEARPLRN